MSAKHEDLRPHREIAPVTEALLRAAYRSLKESGTPARGEELRFNARATRQQLEEAGQRGLLTGEGSQDMFRPTAMGLLYLVEAEEDVEDLGRLVEYANKAYRPGVKPLQGEEVAKATGFSLERLAWLERWANDVSVNLHGKPPTLTLEIYEHNWELPTLAKALAQRFASQPGPSLFDRPGGVLLPPAPFGVRLERLAVSNFRALDNFELELGALTVLVGPNGIGKSTVLDVVALLGASVMQGAVAALDGEGGLARQRTRGRGGPLRLATELQLSYGRGETSRAEYSFAVDEFHGRTVVEEEELKVGGQEAIHAVRGRARLTTPSGVEDRYQTPEALALSEVVDEGKYAVAVGLREALGRVLLIDRDPVVREGTEIQFFGRGRSLRQMFAPSASVVLGHALSTDEQAGKLSAVVREVVPSIEQITRERVTAGIPQLRAHRKGAEFELAELSAGERQLILLAAVYVLERPPTVLLLEEPDAGLSSGSLPALRDLLHSLASKTQVLATTHSPILVELLDIEKEVRALEHTETGVRAVPLQEALRSVAWLGAFGTAEAFARLGAEKRR